MLTSPAAAWIYLSIAIATEVLGTSLLKAASEHPRPWIVSLVVVGYVVSFGALALALRVGMQVGVAYAIWSAVGTAAVALVGVLAYGEPATLAKAGFIAMIIAGVVGLELTGHQH